MDQPLSSSSWRPISLVVVSLSSSYARQVHFELNRLIIARLPLALPPNTTSPQLYATGLYAFAQIYKAFESEWLAIAAASPQTSGEKAASAEDGEAPAQVDLSIRIILSQLCLPRLIRKDRLGADLLYLSTLPSVAASDWDEQRYPHLRPFLDHIKNASQTKPHVLIAYGWVFYMALFSGGRWIRSRLGSPGADFWREEGIFGATQISKPSRAVKVMNGKAKEQITWPGLNFLHFEDPADGENIKQEFKMQLAAVERWLTAEEIADVIEEALTIFKFCIFLVEDLDKLLGTDLHGHLESDIAIQPDSRKPKLTYSKAKYRGSNFTSAALSRGTWQDVFNGLPAEKFSKLMRVPIALISFIAVLWFWIEFSRKAFPLFV